MPYALFYSLYPDLAEAETRTIIVPAGIKSKLPIGEYGFCEMFCNEPGCDCRRVFFSVVNWRTGRCIAVIFYGWESPEFYAKWMKDDNPGMIAALIGPDLNSGSPQSSLAPALLNLFIEELLPNKAYIERVKRHYEMFRTKIDNKMKKVKKNDK